MAKMIKVREFAEECGCTPQNIYLHLKNYAAELEGHTQKGRRGLLLDEFACEFIRGAMYPKEISADAAVMEELNRLRATVLQIGQENARLTGELAKAEAARDAALLESANNQRLLAASEEAKEVQAAELEAKEEAVRAAEAKSAELEAKNVALMSRGLWDRIKNKPV